MERQRIQKVWVDDKCVYARTSNGLVANYPFSMWKRFEGSTPSQRQDFYLSYSGIHWPQLDEDLSFEGMFAQAGLCTRTETEDTIYWEAQKIETKPVEKSEIDLAIEDIKKGNVVSFDNVEDAINYLNSQLYLHKIDSSYSDKQNENLSLYNES